MDASKALAKIDESRAKWRKLRAASDKETEQAVLGAELALSSVSTVAVYNLPHRVIVAPEGALGTRYGIIQVRVTSTRYHEPPPEDEDYSHPILDAAGLGRPVTAKGVPDKRLEDFWMTLPVGLVAPLLGRALTA